VGLHSPVPLLEIVVGTAAIEWFAKLVWQVKFQCTAWHGYSAGSSALAYACVPMSFCDFPEQEPCSPLMRTSGV
jgi:hypothetical protein